MKEKIAGNAVGQIKKSLKSVEIRQIQFEKNRSRLISQNLRQKFRKNLSFIGESPSETVVK